MDAVSSDSIAGSGSPVQDPKTASNADDTASNDLHASTSVVRSQNLRPSEKSPTSTSSTAAEAGSFQMTRDKRRIIWQSRLYPGKTITFHYSKDCLDGDYYVCNACANLCNRYKKCLEACDIKRQTLLVKNGQFLKDPDLVGTTRGHLCMQPELVEVLKAKLAQLADVHNEVTASAEGTALSEMLEEEDHESRRPLQSNSGTVGKPSRKRSVTLRTSRSAQARDGDAKSFGLVKFVGLSQLADRQRRLVESLPAKLRNAMRGKEAVKWFDKEQKVTLLFLLVDESRLVDGAWEYYCDGCYGLSKGEIDFTRPSAPGPKQWFRCTACDDIRTTLKAKIPGCITVQLFSAIVRDGHFVERDPDVCGLKLEFANGTSRCVHVCLDAKLQQLMGELADPPPKQMRLSSFFDKPYSTPNRHRSAGNAVPIGSSTPLPGCRGSPQVDYYAEEASSVRVASGRTEPNAASLTRTEQNPNTPSPLHSDAKTAITANALPARDNIPDASNGEVQYVMTTVKQEPAGPRSRFNAFIELEGLKEEFAEWDLEYGRSYATNEKSHVAFMKQRRLLEKYADFMS